jgi:hypothetical protein
MAAMAQDPLFDLYDPKMLAVMEQAFNATWAVLEAHDVSHDEAKKNELRMALSRIIVALVADGVTDPDWLRKSALERLPLSR